MRKPPDKPAPPKTARRKKAQPPDTGKAPARRVRKRAAPAGPTGRAPSADPTEPAPPPGFVVVKTLDVEPAGPAVSFGANFGFGSAPAPEPSPAVPMHGEGTLSGTAAATSVAGTPISITYSLPSEARAAVSADASVPVAFAHERSDSAATSDSIEATLVRPAMRPNWQASRDDVLHWAADGEIVELYRKVGEFLLGVRPGRGGHNWGHDFEAELEEALSASQDDRATAESIQGLLGEQLRLDNPDAKVIQHGSNAFKMLVHGARALGGTVTRWITEGVIKGEVAHYAPALIGQLVDALRRAIEALAHLLQ